MLSKADREAIKKYGGEIITDEPEEMIGAWIYGEYDIPHCSKCGTEVMPNEISEYCPVCHAHMIEEE